MSDVEDQGPDAGSVPLENGAAAEEQPSAEDIPESAAAPAEEVAEDNADAAAEADTENNNKRKLEDDEAEAEEDGPAKKKPVIAAGEAEAAGEDDPAGNGVQGSDPPADSTVGDDPKLQAENTATHENGSGQKGGEKVISVPRNMVGKLIGREGATIRDLQIRSGAKIQIDHSSEGSNKTVTLIGEEGQISLAETLIKQTLEPDSAAADAQKTVECPPGIVGRIIGRGGETIKALQSASNAHIIVDQNFPEGQARKIHISGKPEFVERAVKMITEVIHGEPGNVQTIIQKYGETRVIECPKNVVGRIIGKGGETIKGLQKECHASIQIDQTGDPAKISVMGKRQNVQQALDKLRALINDEPFHGGGQHFPAGGYGAGMRPPFGGPGFQPPYPAPGPYGGFGGYPQGGAAAAPYGYGYPGYPQYGGPQYGGYGAYGSSGAPGNASDPYSSSYSSQAGGYQSAAGGGYGGGAAAPGAQPLWKEERDSEGRPYYYNTKTGVSQWEKPAEMA